MRQPEKKKKKKKINATIHPLFFAMALKYNLFFSLIEMVGIFLSSQASFHRA